MWVFGWVILGLRSSSGIFFGSRLRGPPGSSVRAQVSSGKVVLEVGVVYAWSGASAFCYLRAPLSFKIYIQQQFFQQSWVERIRQVKLRQQHAAGGTLSTGFSS